MKHGHIQLLLVIFFILLVAFLLPACATEKRLLKQEDMETGVVCYWLYSHEGISCVKTETIRRVKELE